MLTKNKTVWKFILKMKDANHIEMPKDSEVLSVQIQDDDICLWALEDPKAEKETRKFGIIGTGHFVSSGESKFIATVQLDKVFGHFNQVYHIFEF